MLMEAQSEKTILSQNFQWKTLHTFGSTAMFSPKTYVHIQNFLGMENKQNIEVERILQNAACV